MKSNGYQGRKTKRGDVKRKKKTSQGREVFLPVGDVKNLA